MAVTCRAQPSIFRSSYGKQVGAGAFLWALPHFNTVRPWFYVSL